MEYIYIEATDHFSMDLKTALNGIWRKSCKKVSISNSTCWVFNNREDMVNDQHELLNLSSSFYLFIF